jgi:hypothetical protein
MTSIGKRTILISPMATAFVSESKRASIPAEASLREATNTMTRAGFGAQVGLDMNI